MPRIVIEITSYGLKKLKFYANLCLCLCLCLRLCLCLSFGSFTKVFIDTNCWLLKQSVYKFHLLLYRLPLYLFLPFLLSLTVIDVSNLPELRLTASRMSPLCKYRKTYSDRWPRNFAIIESKIRKLSNWKFGKNGETIKNQSIRHLEVKHMVKSGGGRGGGWFGGD